MRLLAIALTVFITIYGGAYALAEGSEEQDPQFDGFYLPIELLVAFPPQGELGFVSENPKAVLKYKADAMKGDSTAALYLGIIYLQGLGVEKDETEAADWFRRAAEKENSDAQNYLGLIYAEGLGFEKNKAEAARWFRLAAEQGNLDAQKNIARMYTLGFGVPKDKEEAQRWYQLAADQGDIVAQFELALIAAKEGDAEAQYDLAFMYRKGTWTSADPAKSFHWCLLAAEQGYPPAQKLLGAHYMNGIGVEKDEAEGVRWYRLAAEQGNAAAQWGLGFMYYEGRGVVKSYSEALRFYRLAGGQGDASAQNYLGLMYLAGQGVPKNYTKAYKWFSLAAAQGDGPGRQNLAVVESLMTAQQIAEAQAMAAAFNSNARPEAVSGTPETQESKPPEEQSEVRLTGTAFFVSKQGHLLTNYHVVDGCSSVRVTNRDGIRPAQVEAVDKHDDLALLQVASKPRRVAGFRRKTAATGEDVLAIGFPLQGLLTSINVTTGSVSATTGVQGDRRYLQISAPVQQGNSGGPLLDASGAVVGVIVSKLNAVAVANAIGDVPQNVNFAIKAAVARSFLNIHDINAIESTNLKPRDRVKIAAEAEDFTVLVECLN